MKARKREEKKCSIIIRSFDDNPKRCVDFFFSLYRVQCENEKDILRMHDSISGRKLDTKYAHDNELLF